MQNLSAQLTGMIMRFYPSNKSRDDELVLGSWEGNPLDIYTSLITGINVENVMILEKEKLTVPVI